MQQALWKGLAAGLAGGIAASWAMNVFQSAWSQKSHGTQRSHGAQSLQRGSPRHGAAQELQKQGSEEESDDAAIRTAKIVSENVFGHKLKNSEKHAAGTIAHYAMGATSGMIYGTVAEVLPVATVGAGLPFGVAVWLIADEGVVPALGLSKAPTAYPPSIHAYALASHLVYGLATEIVRRTIRQVL